jgi:hypothetical protein
MTSAVTIGGSRDDRAAATTAAMKYALVVVVASCIPDSPYSGPQCSNGDCHLDPDATYVVNVTDGHLRSEADAITFNVHRGPVVDAFAAAPGAVGVSLRIRGLEIATVSMWTDEASLAAFVSGSAHAEAMAALADAIAPPFLATHWSEPGSALPLAFDDALAHAHAAVNP